MTKRRKIEYNGFRWPARRYFRRRVMLVYESLEVTFDPRNILFRDLGRILPA